MLRSLRGFLKVRRVVGSWRGAWRGGSRRGHSQKLRSLVTKADQALAWRGLFVHPIDALLVPASRLLGFPPSPMRHRKKKWIAVFGVGCAEFAVFLQGGDGVFVVG